MKKGLLNGVFVFILTILQLSLFAQQDLKQTTTEVKGWFESNWQWVVGVGVILLVIIAAAGRRRGNRKTTTVVKDNYGNVKSVTSTEVRE